MSFVVELNAQVLVDFKGNGLNVSRIDPDVGYIVVIIIIIRVVVAAVVVVCISSSSSSSSSISRRAHEKGTNDNQETDQHEE
jgi:flagellar basal body-associated protein FliL